MYNLHALTLDDVPPDQHQEAVAKALARSAWWYQDAPTPAQRRWELVVSDDNNFRFNPAIHQVKGIPTMRWLKRHEFEDDPLLFVENMAYGWVHMDRYFGRDFEDVAHRLTTPDSRPYHQRVDYGKLSRASHYLEHLLTTYPDRQAQADGAWDIWTAEFWNNKFDHEGVTNLMKNPDLPQQSRYVVLLETRI